MKRTLAVGLVGALACAAAAWLGLRRAGEPFRCGEGFVGVGPRCCGEGQVPSGDACAGAPRACGADHDRTDTGCVPRRRRVRFEGGSVLVGPSDWEAEGTVPPRTITVGAFSLDAFEVDVGRHGACVAAGACKGPVVRGDAGRAAVFAFDELERLCAHEGARVPTDDEWIFAATGGKPRRYPWGDTGAVCGRAAFALAAGPCARGLAAPDTVGARPEGRTPEGLFDMAGNAAEWTRGPEGPMVRGGSFASSLATELRVWHHDPLARPGTTGGRCAASP